jgi:hypothetical protein
LARRAAGAGRKISTTQQDIGIELVVARYKESLSWLKRVPPSIAITVYDKCDDGEAAQVLAGGRRRVAPAQRIVLPNVGRESHTYLWHMAQRYDSLAPLTVFCQGHPFDHAYFFHASLRDLAQEARSPEWGPPEFKPFGHIIDTDDARGQRLFAPWSKNEDGRGLDMRGFHRALWGSEGPELYPFRLGAQFAASNSCILRQPREWYEKAARVAVEFPDAPHCFERSWALVLGVENPDVARLNGELTLYLKMVRRLEDNVAVSVE